MNTETLKEIETNISAATNVSFLKTRDYRTSPPTIALVFHLKDFDSKKHPDTYNNIFTHFKNGQTTIVLRKQNQLLDLSIVDRETANSINLYGLKYDIAELEDFSKNTEKDWGIAFVLGFFDKEGYIGLYNLKEFLVCWGYSVS